MMIVYKCPCMEKEREIDVPDRIHGSDVESWMDLVQSCISYDHSCISQHCVASSMVCAKIPMNEDTGEIGVPDTVS